MATSDLLHQILNLRKGCLSKLNDDSHELGNLCEQLFQWQEQVIKNLKKFVHERIHEIKQKYSELHRQQLKKLDTIYRHCVDGHPQYDYQRSFLQLSNGLKESLAALRIFHRKPIDFNLYLQFNTDSVIDTNRLNLSSYKLTTGIPIQSNIDSLMAMHDCVLVYYDHYVSSAFLHVFDLRTYLEQQSSIQACARIRVPCTEFHGKIMHMEYCAYVQGFLLGTGSKLFTVKISTFNSHYQATEYFDFVKGNLEGILRKFACDATSSHLIFLLLSTFEHYTVVRLDLSQHFQVLGQWNYPREEDPSTGSLMTSINDFVLGNNVLVFAVNVQSKDSSTESYQFHVRSLDMKLQYCFELSPSQCPLRLCMIPMDYSTSASAHEQFLAISKKSQRLSLYRINANEDQHLVQFIEDMQVESEPTCLGFAGDDPSLLLVRNLFSIAVYKQNTPIENVLRTSQVSTYPSPPTLLQQSQLTSTSF